MDPTSALLLVLLATASSGLAALEWHSRHLRDRRWQTVRLHFGRDVTPEAVITFLDAVAGLYRYASVVLDVQADHAGISHYLSSDRATLDTLRGTARALLPSMRLEPVEAAAAADILYRSGRSVRLRGRLKVLRSDTPAEVSAGLLAAVQPLGEREHLLMRWVLQPGRPARVPQPQDPHGRELPTEHRRLLKLKNEGSVLRARGVVAVASHPERARHVLGRVTAVLRTRSTAYGFLRSAPRSSGLLRRDLAARSFLVGDRYAANELAGLLAWPINAPVLPGLNLGTSPLLMPSPRLPRSGRVLGTATWPGAERPVAQPVVGALSHSLIAGPTGVGKSTLLTNLVSADIAAGRGVVLIDGKGDTATAVLARIPESRHSDVIVLDCASSGPLPGLQLFSSRDAELAADVVLGVLSDLFKDSWGPLSERYLRAGLVAVAHDPAGTLADVPFVFTDAPYRRKLVGKLRDPLTRATFASFEAMSAGERQQQLAAPLNKLGTLLGRPVVRTVLGQAAPKLDFAEVLRARKIVVVSLAPARVGSPAARLIGALTVFALFQAVQGRAGLSERARLPFMVCIDEPRALGDLPMPLDALLEQARGLGVGVTLAPQSMAQLPKSVREAALTNVATRVVFRQHADDARLLARDLPGVTAEELGDLAAYEAVARIGLGPGDVAPSVTIRTVPLGKPVSDSAALRADSADRYGVSLAEVDAALDAHHHQQAATAPVGRKRRAA
jgi:energy-coupling factor transporter ATP-binding protein EcfA2